jgi:hypothetical protein
MSDINLSISTGTNVLTQAVGSDEVNLALSSTTNVHTTVIQSENTISIDLVGSVTPTSLLGLTDVNASSITNNQLLQFDSTTNTFVASDLSLNEISDVTISSVGANQTLVYDVSSGNFVNSTLSLNQISDVTISSVANNQVLAYDATSGNFVNVSLDSDSFNIDASEIAVNLGSGLAGRLVTANADGTLNAENLALWDTAGGEALQLVSVDQGEPGIVLDNRNSASANPSYIRFRKDKGAAGAAGDDIGVIDFLSDDAGQTQTTFVQILSEVEVATDGQEGGKLTLSVASHDADLEPGLVIKDGDADGEVDVVIGNGSASLTTISGNLNASGEDHTFTSATADKPVLTLKNTNTTISSQAELKFLKDAADVGAGESLGSIGWYGDNDAGTPETIQYGKIITRADDVADGQEAGRMYLQVANYDGVLANGVFIDGDTNVDGQVDVTIGTGAASTTTIDGTLTMGSTAAMTNVGQLSVAAQPNITTMTGFLGGTANALITDDGDGTVTSEANAIYANDSLQLSSSVSGKPTLELVNSNTDAEPAELIFQKTDNGTSNDGLGIIKFKGDDDGGGVHSYAEIEGKIEAAAGGSEEGKLTLSVASHDGELQPGLIIASGNVEDEVDTTIGNGTASTTTIAGDLTVTSKATIPTRVYGMPGTSDGDHVAGDVVFFGGTTSMTAGKCYYFTNGGAWALANAGADATATGLLAIALGDESDVDGMLLRGMVTPYSPAGTDDEGKKVYLRATDGTLTTTIPTTSGQFVRIVGYMLHASNDAIYFCPDNTFVEIA